MSPTKKPKTGRAVHPVGASVKAPIPLTEQMGNAKPFPIDVLPDTVAAAVHGTIDIVQAPDALCAQTAIGALAYAAQSRIDVMLPTKSVRPVSLFLGTLGKTGERKSEVDGLLAGSLYSFQAMLAAAHAAALAKALKAKKTGQNAPMPLTPLILFEEPSFEGLRDLFVHGHPSLCILSDEGAQLVSGYAMSEDQRMRTAAGLSNLWNGKPISRVRAGAAGATLLDGRRLTVHLMIQPDKGLAFFTQNDLKNQGVHGRFLVCFPKSKQGTRFSKEPSPGSRPAIAAFNARVLDLLRRSYALKRGAQNVLAPRVVPFSSDAAKAFFAFADENEAELGDRGRYAPICGLANKAAELAGRIAAVLQWYDEPRMVEVSKQSFERGVELMRYYLEEALRLNESAPATERMVHAKALHTWLGDSWPWDKITMADILQRGPGPMRRKVLAVPAIEELERRHWLVRLQEGSAVHGKEHRDAWKIAPELRKSK